MSKWIFTLLVAALPLSAQPADLGWIAGHWSGTIGRAHSEEHWIAPKGGMMLGVSRTTVGDRVVGFEFLRIVTRPDGVFYVAQPGGRPPTEFKLTKWSANEAVFENPQHDHPKIISYKLDGNTITATIEGDEKGQHKKQEFRFQRVSKP